MFWKVHGIRSPELETWSISGFGFRVQGFVFWMVHGLRRPELETWNISVLAFCFVVLFSLCVGVHFIENKILGSLVAFVNTSNDQPMKNTNRIFEFGVCCFIIVLGIMKSQISSGQLPEKSDSIRTMTYAYLREADAMWAKRVWRVIDLNEKINLPLKYPLHNATDDRKSLIDVLLASIQNGELQAYSYLDDQFTLPINYKEIEVRGGARMDSITISYPDPPYIEHDTLVYRDFSPDNVIGYRVKEDWFFDKQRSEMDVRIIGIAPLIYDRDESGTIREGNIKKPLFWIYYPQARALLKNAPAFNRENDAARLTFDDIFQKRMFGSYIYKESNVYDRLISDYRNGLQALIESEKIKEEIINFEHEMWEF